MEGLSAHLEKIAAKVQLVMDQCNDLETRNDVLRTENEALKTELNARNGQIDQLNESLKTLKIAKGQAEDDEDRKALKLKINEYIREIDRCIAMLNK